MPMTLRLLLVLGLLLAAGPAEAACTLATSVAADLGTRTSYDVRSGGASPTAAPPTFSCNGSVLSLVATDRVDAIATSANGFTLRSAAGEAIAYRLSADAAGTQAFTQGSAINYLDPAMLALLGVLNGNSLVPSIYAAVVDTPNVAAGTYRDTVTIRWSWAICRGVGVGGLCVLQERGSGTTTLSVSVTVSRDCRIAAPPVVLGSAPLARQFAAVTQAVAVDCTKGAAFSVALSAGTSGASRPWRAMKSAAGRLLRYNLYRPDGTTIWDEASPVIAGSGTGATAPTVMYPYVARIDPDQPTPPAGSYSDSVSVIVTF